jgi:hypothetical protein
MPAEDVGVAYCRTIEKTFMFDAPHSHEKPTVLTNLSVRRTSFSIVF